ncbi:MAG TPA: nuclear transport factor 2 family protein [Clostridium sp.]|nr:nuclear transport factor 2 family protein [Clostridium sp.]
MNHIEIIRKYFFAVTARTPQNIIPLFDEDCEVFFAHAGILKGKQEFDKFNLSLIESIVELTFDMDNFNYTANGNTVIIEGQESGKLSNGFSFKDNRFCSVFEFAPETNLVKRMFAYTDPNFGEK